jgi:hypothetical protein
MWFFRRRRRAAKRRANYWQLTRCGADKAVMTLSSGYE